MNGEMKEAGQSAATALATLQTAFENHVAGRRSESAAVTEAFLQKKADLSGPRGSVSSTCCSPAQLSRR
jgi:hypothetical protein